MATSGGHILQELDHYLGECPEISEDAKYWFFRTEGGMLYEPFITSQAIAIGYPAVGLETLRQLSASDQNRKKLKKQIRQSSPEEKRPGLAAGQLLTFAHIIKGGDYIIIPSWGSHELTIGLVLDKPPFEGRLKYEGRSYKEFYKQRKVRWIKRIRRTSVNPNLYRILFGHQTVTDVTSCAPWIDPLLFDFFKKGNNFHYVVGIDRKGDINARSLFSAYAELFALADNLSQEIGIEENSGAINTRINLNSPGDVELITRAAKYIFTLAALVVVINGGRVNFNFANIKCNIGTDGLIRHINRWLTDRKNRQLLDSAKQKLDALQIDTSADIVKVIDHINKHKP